MREITVKNDTKMLITELLTKESVDYLRSNVVHDSLKLAYLALNDLSKSVEPVRSSVITFEPAKDALNMKDYVHDVIMKSSYHSVVYLGEMILDPMLSDYLIKTTDYVKQLTELNPDGVNLDVYLSDWEDPISGKLIIPDMDYILNYKAG